MPIPDAPATAGPYNTDGVTTSFPFSYKSFGVGYHAVVKETLGELEQLAYGIDFSVTQNPDQETNPGGNVLISPALPSGSTISIYSNVPYDQPVDLPLGGGFSSAVIRDAFDRIVTLLKQADLAATGGTLLPSDRSLRVPSGESINAFTDAASRAGKFVKFDGSGNASTVALEDAAVTLDGGGNPTANLPMGGYKHTGAAAATDSGQYVVWGQASPVNITGPASSAVALTVGDQSTDGRIAVAAAGLNLSRGNWFSVGSGELAAPTGAMSIGTVAAGAVGIYTNSELRMSFGGTGNVITSVLAVPPSLTVNGQMVFNLTANDNLRISVRGSDGVTRVANITLA